MKATAKETVADLTESPLGPGTPGVPGVPVGPASPKSPGNPDAPGSPYSQKRHSFRCIQGWEQPYI